MEAQSNALSAADPSARDPDAARRLLQGAVPVDPARGRGDLGLVRRALAGDEDAYGALVERFRCVPRFLAWRNRRYGHPFTAEEIEDLQQDVLFEAWRKIREYEGRGPLEAWLQRFSFLVFVHQLRRRMRRPRTVEDVGASTPTTDRALEADVYERELVQRAVDQLGPPDADLIRLRHFEELSFEEAAHRVGLRVASAKTRYYRALAKLRDRLAGGGA